MPRTEARPTGRPIIPQAIEPDEDSILIRSDGTVQAAANVTITDEQMGRMRAGYICAHCYEDLDTAFPDACPVCRFPMREKQAERIAKTYQGNVRLGPETSIEDELAIMNEMRERQNHNSDISRSSILLPGRDF